ncbi:hypothetical protein LAV72_08905 [Lysinibacillus xylanilyticus]|nr:hypothetical protein [Lysinibacillus xylanilyticus]MEB2299740.1 hypothetical protein [Lysinibacillus xylanilyticus]
MTPIISNELNLFAQELQYFLYPVFLQDIAKQVGFVQRSSKYQANESSNTAGVKIQLEYDLLSGQFLNVILFKTWKSFFEIDECKNIKRER